MADLNPNELEAMRVLWEHGPVKPADIQDQFAWDIENATLRSVLRGLVEGSHATRQKRGKAYFYQAKTSRHGVLSKMAQHMAQVFTGGSTADLISQLITREKLSAEEIEQLRQIAADKVEKTNSSPQRRRRKP